MNSKVVIDVGEVGFKDCNLLPRFYRNSKVKEIGYSIEHSFEG